MAQYQHLPIYKTVYELLSLVVRQHGYRVRLQNDRLCLP